MRLQALPVSHGRKGWVVTELVEWGKSVTLAKQLKGFGDLNHTHILDE
jgi:hypothetical protein